MTLILALLFLESKGYDGASCRALAAFMGCHINSMYETTNLANSNGLVDRLRNVKSNKMVVSVSLTKKGKQLVSNAIDRVSRIKRFTGETGKGF